LPLVAIGKYGTGFVKGAWRKGLCDQPGIHIPLTGSGHTVNLRIRQLIETTLTLLLLSTFYIPPEIKASITYSKDSDNLARIERYLKSYENLSIIGGCN
jgi:hypothetical protein